MHAIVAVAGPWRRYGRRHEVRHASDSRAIFVGVTRQEGALVQHQLRLPRYCKVKTHLLLLHCDSGNPKRRLKTHWKLLPLTMAAPRRLLSSISPAALGFAAAGGAGVVAFNMSKSSSSPAEPQKSLEQKPVFPAMGFVSLTLEEARMINHDTRELKFKVPGDEAISGLSPVCECRLQT